MKKRTLFIVLMFSILILMALFAACDKTPSENQTTDLVLKEDMTREEAMQTLEDCDSFTMVSTRTYTGEHGYTMTNTVYATKTGATIYWKRDAGETDSYEYIVTQLIYGANGHEFSWSKESEYIGDSYELISVSDVATKDDYKSADWSINDTIIKQDLYSYKISDNQMIFELKDSSGTNYPNTIVIKNINNTKLIVPERYLDYRFLKLNEYTLADLEKAINSASSITIRNDFKNQNYSSASTSKYTANGYTIIDNDASGTYSTAIYEDGIRYLFNEKKYYGASSVSYTADDFDHDVINIDALKKIYPEFKKVYFGDNPTVKARYIDGKLEIIVRSSFSTITFKDFDNTQLLIPEQYKDYKSLPITTMLRKNMTADQIKSVLSELGGFSVGYDYYQNNSEKTDLRETYIYEDDYEYLIYGYESKATISRKDLPEPNGLADKLDEVLADMQKYGYKIQDDVITYRKNVSEDSNTYTEVKISGIEKAMSRLPEKFRDYKNYRFPLDVDIVDIMEYEIVAPSFDLSSKGDSLEGMTKEQIIQLIKSANSYTAVLEGTTTGGDHSMGTYIVSKKIGFCALAYIEDSNGDKGREFVGAFVGDRFYNFDILKAEDGETIRKSGNASSYKDKDKMLAEDVTPYITGEIESEDAVMTIKGNMVMFEKDGVKILIKDINNSRLILANDFSNYLDLKTTGSYG